MLEDKDEIHNDLKKSEIWTENSTIFSSGKNKIPYLVMIT